MNFGEMLTIEPDTSALRTVSVRGRTVPWLAILKLAVSSTSGMTWTSGATSGMSLVSGGGFILVRPNAIAPAPAKIPMISNARFCLRFMRLHLRRRLTLYYRRTHRTF